MSEMSDLNSTPSSNVNFDIVFSSNACTATVHSSDNDANVADAFRIVPQKPITVFKARSPQS